MDRQFHCYMLIYIFIFSMSIQECKAEVQFRQRAVHQGIVFTKTKNFSSVAISDAGEINAGTTDLVVDLLMMADYSLYQGFLEMSRGDEHSAQVHVQEYLTAVFDQMKLIYDKIQIDEKVLNLNMTGTFIAIREADCPLLTEIEIDYDEGNSTLNSTYESFEEYNSTDLTLSIPAVNAVSKLTSWIKHFNNYLPNHDHAVLITKFDLLSHRGDTSTQGMAFVGEICKAGESSSVVEDVGAAATALIAAHELGHSLGAFHDGNHNKSFNCTSSDNFLMSTTVSGSENERLFYNSRKMSDCSLSSIRDVIRKPSSFCLRKPKIERTQRSAKTSVLLPGERFALHQQCQIAFGPHYGICPNSDYYRGLPVCRRIWCKNRAEKRSAPCETRAYLPAFDGTECGKFKWCIDGECVQNKKKMMDCRDLNAKTCAKYTKVKLRHFCKAEQFRNICCASCTRLKDIGQPID